MVNTSISYKEISNLVEQFLNRIHGSGGILKSVEQAYALANEARGEASVFQDKNAAEVYRLVSLGMDEIANAIYGDLDQHRIASEMLIELLAQ